MGRFVNVWRKVWSVLLRIVLLRIVTLICLVFKFIGEKVVSLWSFLRRPNLVKNFLQIAIHDIKSFEKRTIEWMDKEIKAKG